MSVLISNVFNYIYSHNIRSKYKTEEHEESYKISVRKPQGKTLSCRPTCTREDDVKIDHGTLECKDVENQGEWGRRDTKQEWFKKSERRMFTTKT